MPSLENWKARVATEIAESLGWLISAARNLAPSGIDPEDLLSEAITRLFAIGEERVNEIQSLRSYLTRSMRNIVLDFTKSPRSRVDTEEYEFFTEIPDAPDDERHEIRTAELHREFGLVRQAFAELNDESRAFLIGTLVEGRTALEVGAELGYKPAASSTRLFRAKAALKRSLLSQHLRMGGQACAENAEKLAGEVHEDFGLHSSSQRGIRHIKSCDSCQRNWRMFAGMSQALGVTTALTLALHAEPLVAATAGSGNNLAQVEIPGRLTRSLASRATLVAGVVALVLAAASAGTHFLFADQIANAVSSERRELGPDEQLDAHLNTAVSAVPGDDNVATLDVSFDITNADWWQVESLAISLPPGATITDAPAGLVCGGTTAVVACVTAAENWNGARFNVHLPIEPESPGIGVGTKAGTNAGASEVEGHRFDVQLRASSVRGIEISGEATTYLDK